MHHYSLHKFHSLPHWGVRELKGLYEAVVLRKLGVSLISLFLPIYIYNLYPNLSSTDRILKVVLFFIILETSALVLTIPMGKIILRIGFKRSIFLGNFSLALRILFLILAKENTLFLWINALFYGISEPLYWYVYHLVFIERGQKKALGKAVGLANFLERISSAIGPLLGGLVLTYFSFSHLFFLAMVLIVFSSIPLSRALIDHKHTLPRPVEILGKLFSRQFRPYFLTLGSSRANDLIAMIVWPIFIYLLFGGNLLKVGSLTALTLVFSMIFLLLVGKWADEKGKSKTLSWGALVESIIWALKSLVFSLDSFLFIDSADKIIHNFFLVPLDALVYKKGKEFSEPYEFIILRSTAMRILGVFAVSLIAALIYFGLALPWIFFLGTIFTMVVFMVILKGRKSEQF